MEEKDFIFEGEGSQTPEGPFKVGSIVIVNGENFTLTKLVDSREVFDGLGFPAIYSWYEAKNGSEDVNLFFFDEDIDSVEKNKAISEKWWRESYRN